MGYDFDLTKMPGDLQALYYQAAAKYGNRNEIDNEMEYSLFRSRAKNLLDSGKASYSKETFNNIFNVQIYQNKITPTEKEAERIAKLLSNGAPNFEFEKIDTNLYRYTTTYGDIKTNNYTQTIGTVIVNEKSCYSGGNTYNFYTNGSMDVFDSQKNTSILYDKNNNIIK